MSESSTDAVVETMTNEYTVANTVYVSEYSATGVRSGYQTLELKGITGFGAVCKRGLDILIASVAFTLLAPLMAIIAALVKLDSRGPAFYRSTRIGKDNQEFECLKFRSMIVNADDLKEGLRSQNQRQGATFKIAGDPRITRFGAFIRRYSLDELPQIVNVLKGDMSIVGPRPHPVDDVARYESSDLERHRVKPGITGLWQVEARRDPSFRRNMELDLEYIRNWSLMLDLRIICKTFAAVIRGEGQ